MNDSAPLPSIDALFASGLSQFLADDWCERPAFVKGTPAKLAALVSPTIDAIGRLALGEIDPNQWATSEPEIKAAYAGADGVEREMHRVPPRIARDLFNAGMTLCVRQIDRRDATLARLVDDVRRAFAFAGAMEINCYVSPNDKGFGWHYDSQHVVVMQLDGSKRWEVSRAPGLEWPPFNVRAADVTNPEVAPLIGMFGVHIDPPSPETTIEYVLEPGDLLYMPPGTWHRAFAKGRSVALSLTLFPFTFARALRRATTFLAIRNLAWRRDLHALGWQRGLDDERAPPELVASLREEIAKASREIAALSPEAILRVDALIAHNPLLAEVLEAAATQL
jgi:ribosomal protein L16 Arg81 hydroxylase